MEYLTHEQYCQMGGALSQQQFAQLALRARNCIDAVTHGRLARAGEAPEAAARAAFALVEAMHADAAYAGREVASMSNDDLSVAFAGGGAPARYAGIARAYLSGERAPDGTPLLYAGVDA